MSRLVVREHITPDLGESRGALVEMCLTGRTISDALVNREQMNTHQLVKGDLRAIFIEHKPPSITCNRSDTNIDPDNQVSDKEPFGHHGSRLLRGGTRVIEWSGG